MAVLLVPPAAKSEDAYPPARDLIEGVIRAIPSEPIDIVAELQSRAPGGKLDRLVRLEMSVHAQVDSYASEYRILDAFGRDREAFAVQYFAEGDPEYVYNVGDSDDSRPPPTLTSNIEGTDLSWAELSLAFLWWDGAKTVGSEPLKGRNCYLVEVPVPAEQASFYANVKIWIDPEVNVFLRAEGYDAAGERVRRMEVKSFKKVGERWLIKHIQVHSYPSRHKTSLRMRSVKVAGQEQSGEPDR